jgi:hypothetical protein
MSEWKIELTKPVAQHLAAESGDGYCARKLHGHWVVWCNASDHVVEFDPRTIQNAVSALNQG